MLKSGPLPHHPLLLMPPCTSSSHTKFTLVPRGCYEASHRVSCPRIILPLIYLQNISAVFSSSQPPGCPVQGQPTHVDVNTLLSTAAPTSCCHCLHTLLGWAMSVQKTGLTSLILLTSVSQSWLCISFTKLRCSGLFLDLLKQIPAAKHLAHLKDSPASGIGRSI